MGTINPWEVDSIKDFRSYHCPACKHQERDEDLFVKHVKQNHVESLSTKVFNQDYDDNSCDHVPKVFRLAEPWKCVYCEMVTWSSEKKFNHFCEASLEPIPKPIKGVIYVKGLSKHCKKCNRVFETFEAFEKHILGMHKSKLAIVCQAHESCVFQCDSHMKLRAHLLDGSCPLLDYDLRPKDLQEPIKAEIATQTEKDFFKLSSNPSISSTISVRFGDEQPRKRKIGVINNDDPEAKKQRTFYYGTPYKKVLEKKVSPVKEVLLQSNEKENVIPIDDDGVTIDQSYQGDNDNDPDWNPDPLDLNGDSDQDQNQVEQTSKTALKRKLVFNYICKICNADAPSIKAVTAHAEKLHRSEWFRMTRWEDIADRVINEHMTPQDQSSSDDDQDQEGDQIPDETQSYIKQNKKLIVYLEFQCNFCSFYGVSRKAVLVHAKTAHRTQYYTMKTWQDVATKLAQAIPVEATREKSIEEQSKKVVNLSFDSPVGIKKQELKLPKPTLTPKKSINIESTEEEKENEKVVEQFIESAKISNEKVVTITLGSSSLPSKPPVETPLPKGLQVITLGSTKKVTDESVIVGSLDHDYTAKSVTISSVTLDEVTGETNETSITIDNASVTPIKPSVTPSKTSVTPSKTSVILSKPSKTLDKPSVTLDKPSVTQSKPKLKEDHVIVDGKVFKFKEECHRINVKTLKEQGLKKVTQSIQSLTPLKLIMTPYIKKVMEQDPKLRKDPKVKVTHLSAKLIEKYLSRNISTIEPSVTPKLASNVTPNLAPNLTSNVIQDVTSDMTQDVTPDMTQDVTPPNVTQLETTCEKSSDKFGCNFCPFYGAEIKDMFDHAQANHRYRGKGIYDWFNVSDWARFATKISDFSDEWKALWKQQVSNKPSLTPLETAIDKYRNLPRKPIPKPSVTPNKPSVTPSETDKFSCNNCPFYGAELKDMLNHAKTNHKSTWHKMKSWTDIATKLKDRKTVKAPNVTPNVTSNVTPDVTPNVTPDMIQDVTPNVIQYETTYEKIVTTKPSATPKLAQDVTPDVTPNVAQFETTENLDESEFELRTDIKIEAFEDISNINDFVTQATTSKVEETNQVQIKSKSEVDSLSETIEATIGHEKDLLAEVQDSEPPQVQIQGGFQWQCYVCGEERNNRMNIVKHCTSHYKLVKHSMYGSPCEYQCLKCKVVFRGNRAKMTHYCGKVIQDWMHLDTVKPVSCDKCKVDFKSYHKYMEHYSWNHEDDHQILQCPKCLFQCVSPSVLAAHDKNRHTVILKHLKTS